VTGAVPGAVLFDWDGTLCDSGGASLRAFRKSLAEFGIAFTDAEYRALYTPRWYRMYEALGLPAGHWEAADQRWLHHYRHEEPELMPGAARTLEALAGRRIRLGIVTSGTRDRIARELARHCLSDAFCAVVCHEDVAEKKPHPEGIEKALASIGGSCAACWYVGDTPEDIQMGKRAGVFTLGVLTEYVDACRMEAAGADRLLASIEDLAGILPAR
jgi:phosphoglycolate phosphatase